MTRIVAQAAGRSSVQPAEQGYAGAQLRLGTMYADGQGVPKDDAEALRWYRKAAEQGDADAQAVLGVMYWNGRGVPKDYVQAYMWFNLAAAGGSNPAAQGRDLLEHSMTVQQIAEAQRRTAAWRSTRSGEQQAAPGKSDDPGAAFNPEPAPEAAKPASEAASGQLGTGFFIGEGVLLTNAHVVKGCSEVSIGPPVPEGFEPVKVTARVVASDDDNDLALLRTAAHPPAIAALRLSVRQGEAVAAYGFPLPGLLASGGNLTTGNITALSGIGDDSRFLQISAPVQPGNSGGPLLDGGGNVVGIVEGKLNAIKIATFIGDVPQNVNFAIKASVVATFLDNNSVNYRTGQVGAAHSPADIADDAKRFTVPVECDRVSVVDAERTTGPATPAKPAPPKDGLQLHRRAQEFIAALYSTTSGPTDEASAAFNNIYADTVTYFGKELSREQVITQVQRFLARWQIRQYKPKERTVKIDCDEDALTCAVTGVMQFDAQSPLRNERSTGEATFEYRLRFPSSYQQMPKITVEDGTVLKRSVQALSPANNGSPLNFFDRR